MPAAWGAKLHISPHSPTGKSQLDWPGLGRYGEHFRRSANMCSKVGGGHFVRKTPAITKWHFGVKISGSTLHSRCHIYLTLVGPALPCTNVSSPARLRYHTTDHRIGCDCRRQCRAALAHFHTEHHHGFVHDAPAEVLCQQVCWVFLSGYF